MDKKILFVSEKSSFLLNTITSGLEATDIICREAAMNVNDIAEKMEDVQSLFLFIEPDTVFEHPQELHFIAENSENGRKYKIFLMGNSDDTDACADMMSSDMIAYVFTRPINVVEVTESITKYYDILAQDALKRRILVVDDSNTYLQTIEEWLRPYFRIDMVSSATSAISYLTDNRPDLILLDYEMPVCDGPKLLEMIRSDSALADIHVIFLTGKGDRASVERVLSLGVDGYLLKSLPKDRLVMTVREFMDKH